MEARKKPAGKILWWRKIRREIWLGTMARALNSPSHKGHAAKAEAFTTTYTMA